MRAGRAIWRSSPQDLLPQLLSRRQCQNGNNELAKGATAPSCCCCFDWTIFHQWQLSVCERVKHLPLWLNFISIESAGATAGICGVIAIGARLLRKMYVRGNRSFAGLIVSKTGESARWMEYWERFDLVDNVLYTAKYYTAAMFREK